MHRNIILVQKIGLIYGRDSLLLMLVNADAFLFVTVFCRWLRLKRSILCVSKGHLNLLLYLLLYLQSHRIDIISLRLLYQQRLTRFDRGQSGYRGSHRLFT